LLGRAVGLDPHLARDWADLALAEHELGNIEARDHAIARAIVISPTIQLTGPLVEISKRMIMP
jgi:hypothetical protein